MFLLAAFLLLGSGWGGASLALAQQGREPSFGVAAVVSDKAPRWPGIDVLHYEIAVELPETGREVVGRTEILYEAVGDSLSKVRFDFAGMAVDSVAVDGVAAPFRHAGGELVVETPGTAPGARSEATVWYHGVPQHGLVVRRSKDGSLAAFADNWPDRARWWFPGIDHPSDKATVAFEVSAPAGVEVVANGIRTGERKTADGRRWTRWAMSSEIPTYGMVIGATDFATTRAGEVDGVAVEHWTLAADSAAGEAAFARSVEILGLYDSLFGPHPYEKLAHVQLGTRFGAMENPSAIFYPRAAITRTPPGGSDGTTALVAHETVHQWFGNAVTEKDWNHLWLSEGFASYLAAVFFEFRGSASGRGTEELARRMRRMAEEVFAFQRRAPDAAVVDPGLGPGEYEKLLTPLVYEKGAWVLHMLRRRVGDEAFFDALRDYYATLRDGTAWTADFERIVEEASGMELGWFFAQWLARPGHPVLAVETAPLGKGGKTWTVGLRQVQEGEPFRFAVDLKLVWTGGSRVERVEVDSRESRWRFEVPAPLERVEVDPGGWLLHQRTR
ncbi:MAG: M1 family metallopeptidase [Gemmatimonadota bacterium]|nr:M1 family metallopeptidase [Gemmatimonadota bacterium]